MRRLISLNPTIRCIGVASCLGAPRECCAEGPAVLKQAGLEAAIQQAGLDTCWSEIAPAGRSTAGIADLLRRLADATATALAGGERPLLIGGDHSMAAGSWRGVGRALGKAPGLIWIDAHLDAHTPSSSPSGNAHGMPVAALFGHGDPAMTDIPGPCLDPRRTVLLGVRSFEPAERERLMALGVRIYDMAEIEERGLSAVFAEARRTVAGGFWGISLDLDAIDPSEAPGVSTPVADGLASAELVPLLYGVLREPDCVAFEIAEYNPLSDPDRRTARLVVDLVGALAAAELPWLRER